MLMWCSSRSFCISQCCCGAAPARFVIRNVAVVRLLLMFHYEQIVNVSKQYVCDAETTNWHNCECVFIESPICHKYVCSFVAVLLQLQISRQRKLAQTWFCFCSTPPSSDNQTQFWHIRVYIIFPMLRSDPNDLGLRLSIIMVSWIETKRNPCK